MGLVNFSEDKILDHFVGKTAWTMPEVWLALSTTTPTEAGANITEPSGNGYVRKATVGADWAASVAGAIANAAALAFAAATGSWGTCTHFALFDAVSGGNCIGWAILTVSKTPGAGDVVSFAIGELDITLD